MFCAGANIRMLAQSIARVEGELLQVHQRDPQRHRGRDASTPARPGSPRSTAPRPVAATSSPWPATRSCLIDDGSSTVSLPEVPLLGVLPGTGGLTRVVDKRHVRKDRADLFATKSEGYRGEHRRRVGPGRRHRAAQRLRRGRSPRAPARPPRRRPGPATTGVELTPLDRTRRRRHDHLPLRDRDASTGRRAASTSRCRPRRTSRRPTPMPCAPRASTTGRWP